ncbi:MAG: type 1 glutamine amidotransferase [Pirellulales bacterium]|nr:type 1 glutamine amidotransferase [Pirellulales bacterium]
MRLHYLQHVPFEDLANVAVWAARRGHAVTGTRLFAGERLPAVDTFDFLVVLGGPMNVDQHGAYPWLAEEKRLLGEAIARGRRVLGICLGAQLAAQALGARVMPNRHREIGWFPVSLTAEGQAAGFLKDLPPEFPAFHWHGDTFEIPAGAVRLAGSAACPAQAFQHGRSVLGLQFHLEYSHQSIAEMLHYCRDEMVGGAYVQSPEEIADRHDAVGETEGLLLQILDAMQDRCAGGL